MVKCREYAMRRPEEEKKGPDDVDIEGTHVDKGNKQGKEEDESSGNENCGTIWRR